MEKSDTYVTYVTSIACIAFTVLIMNDELLQRLAGKRGTARPVVHRRTDTSAPLNYHSPPAEVEAWLRTKGFSQQLSVHYWKNLQLILFPKPRLLLKPISSFVTLVFIHLITNDIITHIMLKLF